MRHHLLNTILGKKRKVCFKFKTKMAGGKSGMAVKGYSELL